MTDIKIPKMRTIRQASKDCDIPEHFLRQLVKQNKIIYVMAGSKALVNVEKLIEYLNEGEQGAVV